MSRTLHRLGATLFATTVALAALGGCSGPAPIGNPGSGMCLDVVNQGVPQPGTPVLAKACDAAQNQRWAFGGTGRITGPGGLCMDVQGGIGRPGARVIYMPCTGALSQFWTAAAGGIVGVGDLCLDTEGGQLAPGTPLVLNICRDVPSQRWAVR